VRIVNDVKTNKPRGYAFIEFEREKDMKSNTVCSFPLTNNHVAQMRTKTPTPKRSKDDVSWSMSSVAGPSKVGGQSD